VTACTPDSVVQSADSVPGVVARPRTVVARHCAFDAGRACAVRPDERERERSWGRVRAGGRLHERPRVGCHVLRDQSVRPQRVPARATGARGGRSWCLRRPLTSHEAAGVPDVWVRGRLIGRALRSLCPVLDARTFCRYSPTDANDHL
jgi:hypothetical protein